MPEKRKSGFYVIASGFGMGMLGFANPCMGSFVGRDATATHCTTKQVWSRYDKPPDNPANE
jgi:hypothetical protein